MQRAVERFADVRIDVVRAAPFIDFADACKQLGLGLHARRVIVGRVESVDSTDPPAPPRTPLACYIRAVPGNEFPSEVARLFWDVDPDVVDLEAHADYVMERVMSRGTWPAMQWLRAHYPAEVLARFMERKGHRLAPRDRAYWALIAGVQLKEEPGGGRPTWAGP